MVDLEYGTQELTAQAFVALAERVWPREYDLEGVAEALRNTVNIGAWDGDRLVGSVRVLSDGHLFATLPEILVDPEYQRRGVGRRLMAEALRHAPRGNLFFGAQPESVGFFERLGCKPGPIGFVASRSDLDDV
jgi:GNAT superfamily N-acetyltransferase